MTDTQDQLIVLPGTESADGSANNASQERAKRRSGSLSSMLLPELQALAGSMGRGPAHEAVAEAVRTAHAAGRPLADVLAERTGLDVASLSVAPDVGEAAAQVEAVLSGHVQVVYGES